MTRYLSARDQPVKLRQFASGIDFAFLYSGAMAFETKDKSKVLGLKQNQILSPDVMFYDAIEGL